MFWQNAVFGQFDGIKNINSNTLLDYVDPPPLNISSVQSSSRFAMQKSSDSPIHYWCSVLDESGKTKHEVKVKRGKCKYSLFIIEKNDAQ